MSANPSDDGDNEAAVVATEAVLEEQIELLSEKSAETRNIAFKFLNKHMRRSYANEDFFAKYKETLQDAISRGLRKGATKERILAAETASVLLIRIGGDETIYNSLSPTLKEMILNPALPDEVRAATSRAFALTNFISNEDETATTAVLPIFRDIFVAREGRHELEAAALEAYALLATTVADGYIYEQLIPQDTLDLVELLNSDSVEVRVAAGQCIALLFEVGRAEEGEDFDIQKFSYYANVDADSLLDTLSTLVSDKTKSRAKKDKIKQKEPFKDILATVEFGDTPFETLSILHQKVDFSSWTQLLQLYAMRRYLGVGLQAHLESNDLLHQMFSISLDLDRKKKSLTAVEKRKTMSPSSDLNKYRSRNLGFQRDNKAYTLDAALAD